MAKRSYLPGSLRALGEAIGPSQLVAEVSEGPYKLYRSIYEPASTKKKTDSSPGALQAAREARNGDRSRSQGQREDLSAALLAPFCRTCQGSAEDSQDRLGGGYDRLGHCGVLRPGAGEEHLCEGVLAAAAAPERDLDRARAATTLGYVVNFISVLCGLLGEGADLVIGLIPVTFILSILVSHLTGELLVTAQLLAKALITFSIVKTLVCDLGITFKVLVKTLQVIIVTGILCCSFILVLSKTGLCPVLRPDIPCAVHNFFFYIPVAVIRFGLSSLVPVDFIIYKLLCSLALLLVLWTLVYILKSLIFKIWLKFKFNLLIKPKAALICTPAYQIVLLRASWCSLLVLIWVFGFRFFWHL